MRQKINSSEIKEISFLEIIINSWKYKLFFFYILISVILATIALDYLIPKKIKYQVSLKNPTTINLSIYPSATTLASVILHNLATLDVIQIIKNDDQKINLNYYNDYFRETLLSSKNLIEFTKINNAKYNLQNYIADNKIQAKEDRKSHFSIILPESKINDEFLIEYLTFTVEQALKLFQEDFIKIQNNKLEMLEKDVLKVNKLLENSNNKSPKDGNYLIQNISTIRALYEARILEVKENLMYFQNLKKEFDENWVVDGPNKIVVNEKLLKFMKFILPVILSLIIYSLYLIIKLSQLAKKN